LVLSASTADSIQPPAPTPSGSDLAATFWCAYSGQNLILAGIITDSVRYNDSAAVDQDDAVEIRLDALADNLFNPRQDDHQIVIASDGRSANFLLYPYLATVATGSVAANWSFEISLPAAGLGGGALSPGKLMTMVFSLIDDDDGGSFDTVLTSGKRSAQITP
jgi:hypothetical protein